MDNRGQVMGRYDLHIAAVVAAVVGVIVVWQVVEIIDRGLAYTAGALVALGVILLAGWLSYRAGRRVGAWVSEQWGDTHE